MMSSHVVTIHGSRLQSCSPVVAASFKAAATVSVSFCVLISELRSARVPPSSSANRQLSRGTAGLDPREAGLVCQ